MSRGFSTIALLTASVFLLLMAGCWPFSPPTGPPKEIPTPDLLPRTSPENVLYNLRVIYGDKDNIVNTLEDAHYWAEAYRSLFSPDTFKFYFIPGQQPPGSPEGWWLTNEEVYSFERMLQLKVPGVAVAPILPIDDIQLNWTVGASEPDNRTDGTSNLLHPNWRHIGVSGILLDVIQGANTARVPYGTADYYLSPDPSDSSLWVITEWWDRQPPGGVAGSVVQPVTAAASAPTYSSWGRIKTLY